MRVLAIMVLVGCAGGEGAVDGGAIEKVGFLERMPEQAPNPGRLTMYRYVPQGLGAGRPLLVLLPGCGVTAPWFFQVSGLLGLAEARRFAVVVPEQRVENNPSRCFNWFVPRHQARLGGEPESIVGMVDRMKAELDSGPVVVLGLSAGGAAAATLLATWPERFSAGAVSAGVPHGCAADLFSAYLCIDGAVDLSPAEWAGKVPPSAGPWPRVIIWHGLADTEVNPANRIELVEQWTAVHGVDPARPPASSSTDAGGLRSTYSTDAGVPVVELVEIPGGGHFWQEAWVAEMLALLGIQ